MASTVFSLTSANGANKEVTRQSWKALSLMMHASQSRIMASDGIYGLPTKCKYRRKTNAPPASDLVNRDFGRARPNQLRVTDITEHPTGEGRLYCTGVHVVPFFQIFQINRVVGLF